MHTHPPYTNMYIHRITHLQLIKGSSKPSVTPQYSLRHPDIYRWQSHGFYQPRCGLGQVHTRGTEQISTIVESNFREKKGTMVRGSVEDMAFHLGWWKVPELESGNGHTILWRHLVPDWLYWPGNQFIYEIPHFDACCLFLFLSFILFMCGYFICNCLCTACLQYPWMPEDHIRFSGTRITDVC